jgi:hypothetical protein
MITKYNITIDTAKQRLFDRHKDRIVLLEFNGAHGKSLFKCAFCGHEWNADTWSVWKGNGCPECRRNNFGDKCRNKIDDIILYIESKNCKLISTEYKNNRTPLQIQFECGHITNMCYASFKRGSRCKICQLERFKISRKYSMDKINKIMEDNKLKFINFPDGYINRTFVIEYSCEYGHKIVLFLGIF